MIKELNLPSWIIIVYGKTRKISYNDECLPIKTQINPRLGVLGSDKNKSAK
jgi:hypothetical protein